MSNLPALRAEAAASSSRGNQPNPDSNAADLPLLPLDAVPILPVRNSVLFPTVVSPFTIGRERSIAAAQFAAGQQRPIGILLQRDAEVADPAAADLYEVGTLGQVLRYVTAPDGQHHM